MSHWTARICLVLQLSGWRYLVWELTEEILLLFIIFFVFDQCYLQNTECLQIHSTRDICTVCIMPSFQSTQQIMCNTTTTEVICLKVLLTPSSIFPGLWKLELSLRERQKTSVHYLLAVLGSIVLLGNRLPLLHVRSACSLSYWGLLQNN